MECSKKANGSFYRSLSGVSFAFSLLCSTAQGAAFIGDFSNPQVSLPKSLTGSEVQLRIGGISENEWTQKLGLPWTTSGADALESMHTYRNLAIVSRDARSATHSVELMLRELPASKEGAIYGELASAYRRSPKDSLFFVTKRPASRGGLQVQTITDVHQLTNLFSNTIKAGANRYLLEDGLVIVEPQPRDARQRAKRLFSSSKGQWDACFVALERNSDDAKAKVALVDSIDSTFEELKNENLLGDQLTPFEVVWRHQHKPAIEADSLSVLAVRPLLDSAIQAAGEGDLCTVTVSMASDSVAEIQYAKKVDAEKGVFQPLGQTIITRAIERGIYTFRAVRKGMQVGIMEGVSCRGLSQPVVIKEN